MRRLALKTWVERSCLGISPFVARPFRLPRPMALGAASGDILLSFGRRGLALTVAGLAIGLVLAAASARLLTSLLYGFQPDYLPAASMVSLILLAVAALACFIPARRASRVDPMIALRNE